MNRNICQKCGGEEFITSLNSYDVYRIVEGKPVFVKTEVANMDFVLFCRECGQRIESFDKEATT